MYKLTVFLIVASIVFGVAQVSGKELDKLQLLKVGGKIVHGTVTQVGVYNFHITTKEGEDLNLHTDADTIRFVPEDERLMVGDLIAVVSFAPENASLSVDKTHAVLVEFITRVERDFLKGDISCLLAMPKYRNGNTCLIEETGQLIRFEGSLDLDPYTKPSTPIKINIKAVPARVGNGYVYVAKTPF
jgi:hypothetical protein